MKNNIIKWLEKPKAIIPVVAVIAIIIGLISYRYIGQAPLVVIPGDSGSTFVPTQSANNSVSLAFPKVGRLATLAVAVGNSVKTGDVLATLEAQDSLGSVNQTKGALELAQAQYAALDIQYANVKKQQDVLVANAYRTLLASNLTAVAEKADGDKSNVVIDNGQVLQISGSYACDQEGHYEISPYTSGVASGYSFTFSGLEAGGGDVTYYTSQPLGTCGLQIKFPVGYSGSYLKWVIDIPNKTSSSYVTNKNAYDLAVATRDQVLKQLEANLGKDGSAAANTAQAAVNSAQGAYEVALANYRNNFIIAPGAGAITFIDSNLKVGALVGANKNIITITSSSTDSIVNK